MAQVRGFGRLRMRSGLESFWLAELSSFLVFARKKLEALPPHLDKKLSLRRSDKRALPDTCSRPRGRGLLRCVLVLPHNKAEDTGFDVLCFLCAATDGLFAP